MKVERKIVGPFFVNVYILGSGQKGDGIIIDPGSDPQSIIDYLESQEVKIKYILATHAHIDHVAAVEDIKKYTGAPFLISHKELPLLKNLSFQASAFGITHPSVPEVDEFISGGDILDFNAHKIKVISTPGHSPGGLSFLIGNMIFVGDSLFAGSIGRTDLPGGSHKLLISSIRGNLFNLDPSVRVYPGHGPETTIGIEKRENPFFN